MLLAVDIGNSSISCGIFHNLSASSVQDETELPVCRCRFKIASRNLSVDEYVLLFMQFLQLHQISPAGNTTLYYEKDPSTGNDNILNACVIASVVPALTGTISKATQVLTGVQPVVIGSGIRTGFGIKIRNPEQLGADIVANTAGAMLLAKPPFVILDVGTATTITYVNKDKELLGTIIMPGIMISLSALTDSAALLANVSLEKPQELLGKSTSESIRSGVIGGHALMIDGFLRNIREQYPSTDDKISLISTGGLAEAILPFCRNKFQYNPDLTLLGEVSLYVRNILAKR